MKYLAILSLLFVVGAFSSESDVLTLTSDNFNAAIEQNSVVLVEFYAPWCGHCKKLAPEYEKAATELKEMGIAGKLAMVDADDSQNTELRTRYGIKGFPTLKLFRNGVPTEYPGDRTASGIVSYMKKQSAPASTPLTTADEATAFSTSDRVVIVGFFNDKESTAYTKFLDVANTLRDSFTFGEVIGNADVAKALGVEKSPAVALFKQFDEKRNNFENFDSADLVDFIKSSSIPSMDEIGPHNFKNYLESGKPLAYLFIDLAKEGKDAILDEVKELVQTTKGKLNWVYIDFSKYAKHAERLGLSGSVVPALAIEKMEEGIHYAYDELTSITKDGVTSWVNNFLEGSLLPTIKSEAAPEKNDGPVKVVVANTFNDIVNDPSKDVFIEFYAPWCGHCKKLAPIFDELGAALESHPTLVVAKIDATANDISPKFNVRGFPTIKLFPRMDKANPVDYEGDRSLEDMLKFINSQVGSSTAEEDEEKDEL